MQFHGTPLTNLRQSPLTRRHKTPPPPLTTHIPRVHPCRRLIKTREEVRLTTLLHKLHLMHLHSHLYLPPPKLIPWLQHHHWKILRVQSSCRIDLLHAINRDVITPGWCNPGRVRSEHQVASNASIVHRNRCRFCHKNTCHWVPLVVLANSRSTIFVYIQVAHCLVTSFEVSRCRNWSSA